MGPRLVNTFPGSIAGPIVPGDSFQLGLKSETASVSLASLDVKLGMTSLSRGLLVPELDPALAKRGASVRLETTERRRPATGAITRSVASNSLQLQKTSNAIDDQCVYEIATPIEATSSTLGHFKIRSSSWTLFSPDWINKTQMTGVYLGLEHGGLGTALYAFLRDNGSGGSLVVGGPLASFGGARPGEQEISFAWTALPSDTLIEIWIFFNLVGYGPPFSPAYEPVVEVWTKVAGVDPSPVIQVVIPASTIGHFVVQGTENFRAANSETVSRLFVGNAGRTGDLLKVDDFEIFPDFRFAVREGIPLRGCTLSVLPDAPVVYQSTDGLLPRELPVGRWNIEGAAPIDSLSYVSAQRSAVHNMSLSKPTSGRMAYSKLEPKMESISPVSSNDGCMIEALLAGRPSGYDGDLFGAGVSLDDGAKLFQVGMLNSADTYTFGLLRSLAQQSTVAGYYLPTVAADFRAQRLLRLVVDRRRNKVSVSFDGVKQIERALSSSTFPSTEGAGGKARFGHVFSSASRGIVDVGFVNYLSRYLAYEAEDAALPTGSSVSFTAVTASDGSGSSMMTSDALHISKKAFGVSGSKRYFSRAHGFAELGGFLADFRARVLTYTNEKGALFSPSFSTGVGMSVFLGNKRLQVVFANCGVFGKKIAVLPGSGSFQDVLSQTALGKKFSAPASWDAWGNYRVVMRAGVSIEVWTGPITDSPALVIPWRDATNGFDLPADSTAPSIAFGHFDGASASESEWGHLRWGSSSGFEAAVTPKFDSLPPYLFGGRATIFSKFED